MMGKTLQAGFVAGLLALGLGTAPASDVEHFEGLPAETVAEAIEHLNTYTAELVALSEGELGPADMAEVHEVTYTLENALARLDQEYAAVAAALEEVHLASERADTDTVREHTAVYADALDGVMR